MVREIRLATRRSAQATTQARVVGDALEAAVPGVRAVLVFVDTLGDQRLDVPLHTMGGQGVFVKEVQRAVLDGFADLAVHSAKDLPSAITPGLLIGAFCERRSAADALVGRSLAALAPGAMVATGSVRRRAQLQVVRPDLRFEELRGNIQTRLTKVPVDGSLVMAVAALDILGLTDRIADTLPTDEFVPAPGQGSVAVECRVDDEVARAALAAIDHHATRLAVEAERAFLAELGTGCSLPLGAHATDSSITGFLADPDRVGDHDDWWARTNVPLSGDGVERRRTAAALARDLRMKVTGE
jgi:hydroxymethylbilane synthase